MSAPEPNLTPAAAGAAPAGAAALRLAPTPPGETPAPPLTSELRPDVYEGSMTFNRDLSWLEFNRRVLELAVDERTPLLERVRFLGIFGSNLDEFVMKRLGMLHQRVALNQNGPDQDGLPAAALLAAMRKTIRELQQRQFECYEGSIRPALSRAGIEIVEFAQLSAEERRWLRAWYRKNVFPVLTPLAVDSGHRFPFISNLSRNLGILMCEPAGRAAPHSGATPPSEPQFARVKIPSVLPQWIPIPPTPEELAKAFAALVSSTPLVGTPPSQPAAAVGTALPARSVALPSAGRYVGLRDIIQNNLDDLFPGMQLVEIVPFRVTRDAEQALEDKYDADNLLEQVEQQLRKRRFAHAVRIETGPSPSPKIVSHLLHELHLTHNEIDERPGLLDYTPLTEIADMDRTELRWPKWTPVVPQRLADKSQDIFSVIRSGDLLVHHPFESFSASVERFIVDASRDPDVLAIKQTIYRTSKDSPFVQALIRAAEQGKQVAVLVELRARFDEQSNVRWAQMLEKAGAHVAYGVIGYKTHCKAAMVVRREESGLRTYVHTGTGNYHPRTANLYTDLGLFTCDPSIADDTLELFNFLTGRSRLDTYETLLVAPINMKRRFIALIQREAEIARAHARGESPVSGRIIAKMNAMADSDIAEQLYEASRAGVDITLFVRGFCCLRPGVPGLSENIRVVSVLGRFLEHSRMFHFGNGRPDPLDGDWYIGSADWMYRNLNNRVEAAVPVTGRLNRAKLWRIVQIMSADRRGSWDLLADGSYRLRRPDPDAPEDSPQVMGTFETMMREARP